MVCGLCILMCLEHSIQADMALTSSTLDSPGQSFLKEWHVQPVSAAMSQPENPPFIPIQAS